MMFDSPAGANPLDRLKVVGQATERIDGPLKTTGTAHYAYEHHRLVDGLTYGWILGSAIAKGLITRMETARAKTAPGLIAVVTTLEHEPLPRGRMATAHLFGGAEVTHYHQAVALVVAETFEQARDAVHLIEVDYKVAPGRFDFSAEAPQAPLTPDASGGDKDPSLVDRVGTFEEAFATSPVRLDEAYTTPGQSHAMMEPHASMAAWNDGKLTLWTSNQMIAWCREDLAKALGLRKEDVRVVSPFIGGGFGAKLFIRADAVLAALGARVAGHTVKVALARPFIFNNTTHRAATRQRLRLAATTDGTLVALAHESTSGNLPGGKPEAAVAQTRLLYAAPHRMTSMRLAALDLPEASMMRAPGEAPGLMALEVAMDEMAERLGMDPVELRIRNDTQIDPQKPGRRFSERHLVECLQTGADRFGWAGRNVVPGQVRDGTWLVGMGMAVGIRNNQLQKSAARVRLGRDGRITVETDMTDIGTGSYTILAQTAAEMMGVTVAQVDVRLGDSDFPESAGSGGQWGANNATAGLYAACIRLRDAVALRLGFNTAEVEFAGGRVRVDGRSVPIAEAARAAPIEAEDGIEYGDLDKVFQQSTFAAHFVEAAVHAYTGEVRVRRMLAVCDAGRILNPRTARSQVIGAMTMGVGAALMEELAVDTRAGFFVNHDLGGYEVPVHADIPHQDVVFLDFPDAKSSPMKAKGVGELGLCGVAAAVANAVYNATGKRVRDYPITLDKHLAELPVPRSRTDAGLDRPAQGAEP